MEDRGSACISRPEEFRAGPLTSLTETGRLVLELSVVARLEEKSGGKRQCQLRERLRRRVAKAK
jgi:hypothetical protein